MKPPRGHRPAPAVTTKIPHWLGGLFGPPPPPLPRETASPDDRPHREAEPETADAVNSTLADTDSFQVVNLDDHRHLRGSLEAQERMLFRRIARRLEAGNLELPPIPATSTAVLDLAARANAEVSEVVRVISSDPVLSSELLRTANSVLYGAHEPVETIHEAVMRVGLRTLRSMVLSFSMRNSVINQESLAEHAEEVWRQSFSVGSIARAIAPQLGMEPERAFLIGMLHDIGKVALIAIVNREAPRDFQVGPTFLSKLFHQYHERAGRVMARKWNLSDELVSVAGQHHRFQDNEEHPRSAALASLAHRLDLFLSIAPHCEYHGRFDCPELRFLQVNPDHKPLILAHARQAFRASHAATLGPDAAG